MLNVGPKPDGTICDEEKSVLLEIGKWMEVNGEAIYGSYPYEICAFEGKKTKNGAFKENKKFSSKDFCFTAKKGKLYIFPMGSVLPQTLKIKSMCFDNEHGIRYDIKRVHILGETRSLRFEQSKKYLQIELPEKRNNELPICICIETE